MSWAQIWFDISFVLLAALKFLVFAPAIAGTHAFWLGLLLNCIAGTLGISVFYFLSEYFMERSKARRTRRELNGTAKPRKSFTRLNKFLVKTKRKLGMIGIAIITPTGISIPIGSIVMAKFYKHSKWAFPSLMISMFLWALLIGSIASLFPDFFERIFPNVKR